MPLIEFTAKKTTRHKSFKAVDLSCLIDRNGLINQKKEINSILERGSYSNLMPLNFKMGLIYLASGEYMNSITYFKQAINLNPELVLYFLGLSYYYRALKLDRSGMINFSKKYYQQASYFYKKSLYENTGNKMFKSIVSFNLCIILMKENSKAEIKKLMNQFLNKKNLHFKLVETRKEKPFTDLDNIINSTNSTPRPHLII